MSIESWNKAEHDEIEHHCGIVATYYFSPPKDLSASVQALSEIQHRGQEGIGAVKINGSGEAFSYHTHRMLADALANEKEFETFVRGDVEQEDIRMSMLHARYSTSGSRHAGQPFVSDRISIAHNGNIVNPRDLYKFIPEELHSEIEGVSDTYALFLALEHAGGKDLGERIQKVLPNVEGAYSLVMADLEEGAIYAASGPEGFRPLEIGELFQGEGIVVASETVSFSKIGEKLCSVKPGQVMKVDQEGVREYFMDPRQRSQARCKFELDYLSHPASEVFGVSVSKYREECGSALSEYDIDDDLRPDLVVPVLDSAIKGAEGYGKKLVSAYRWDPTVTDEQLEGFAVTNALFRNRYQMMRSFIQPDKRGEIVDSKFTIDANRVNGKKVVVVDDSIVRGTTNKRIVQMFRDAGADEVHLRIYADSIKHPCPYGVDFATKEELVAHERTDDEICMEIGADSLRYLPVEKSVQIGKDLSNDEDINFCVACMTGEYPVTFDINKMIRKNGN